MWVLTINCCWQLRSDQVRKDRTRSPFTRWHHSGQWLDYVHCVSSSQNVFSYRMCSQLPGWHHSGQWLDYVHCVSSSHEHGQGSMTRPGNIYKNETCMREEGARGARGPGLRDQIVIKGGAWKLGFVYDLRFSLVLSSLFSLSLVKSSC